MDEKVKVSPYDDDGNLLFGVMPGSPPEEFGESEHPICYNVRLNLSTDTDHMVPIEKPASYDPKQHELLARCIEAGYLKRLGEIMGIYDIPGSPQKKELNNRQFSYVSMSIPGAQTPWSEASLRSGRRSTSDTGTTPMGCLGPEIDLGCRRTSVRTWHVTASAGTSGRSTGIGPGISMSGCAAHRCLCAHADVTARRTRRM